MNVSLRLIFPSLLLSLTACQCGGGGGSSDGGDGDLSTQVVALVITPSNATYETDGVTAATATYSAKATFGDGRTEDVTTKVIFNLLNGELGKFTGNAFTSTLDRGGKTTVSASYGMQFGLTSVTVNLKRSVNDPSATNLPADLPTKFTGAPNAGRAPKLVYPNDGVLLPPNLGKLEVHYLPGAGNTVFELSFESAYSHVKVYLRCPNPTAGGCIYQPDPWVWRALAATNRGAEPVIATLRGTDDAAATFGQSADLSFSFSNDDIQGGLYYWTTTVPTSIKRFDFASDKTVADDFADATTVNASGVNCIGCHALSRDGKKMIVEVQGSEDGRIALLDVAKKNKLIPFPLAARSFFSSWNPDSTKFVGVDDRKPDGRPASVGDMAGADFNLRIIDGANGQLLQSIAGTGAVDRVANHPDWSADGKTIAFSRVERKGPRIPGPSLQWPTNGGIGLVTQDANGAWSAPVDVVPHSNGKNRVYPAIAPSSDYLVFGESTCATGNEGLDCDGDTDVNMRLYAAKLGASATVVELAKANAPGIQDNGVTTLTNSFPKWSPFNFQRTGELGSRLQWVTFSSSRGYGLRAPGSKVWLWMVAMDPDKVNQGLDPSYPAFCLPFQDLATSNHIAQWTTVVVPNIN
ncbi:MAG: hypothetical protein ACT4TC_03430 [Myxococcaceae bacterium]